MPVALLAAALSPTTPWRRETTTASCVFVSSKCSFLPEEEDDEENNARHYCLSIRRRQTRDEDEGRDASCWEAAAAGAKCAEEPLRCLRDPEKDDDDVNDDDAVILVVSMLKIGRWRDEEKAAFGEGTDGRRWDDDAVETLGGLKIERRSGKWTAMHKRHGALERRRRRVV